MSESELQGLLKKMDEVRARLEHALDAAGGNQDDPTVQEVAAEFDRLLAEYMKLRHQPHR